MNIEMFWMRRTTRLSKIYRGRKQTHCRQYQGKNIHNGNIEKGQSLSYCDKAMKWNPKKIENLTS